MQSEVDFVVTLSEWDDNFKDARNVNAKVLFVHPCKCLLKWIESIIF